MFLILCILQAMGLWAGEAKGSASEREASNSPTNGLGFWIWASESHDRQTCQLWKAFDIPPGSVVTRARLRMTVDNEFRLLLDGRDLGRGAEWRNLYEFDLTRLLPPGRHVLAVDAFNSGSFAGMILGLHIDLEDGSGMDIRSDQSWRIVPNGVKGWAKKTKAQPTWPTATIAAVLGEDRWAMMPQQVEVIPALDLDAIRLRFWQTGWFQIILLSVCGLVIAISLRLMAQLTLHRKERWLLERERARIARDIHDDIGSRMTQLVLHGEVAQSELPKDSEVRMQLDRMCEDARQVLYSMDEILWSVNPRRDTLRDFVSFVCSYTQEYLKSTSIKCLLQVESEMSAEVLDMPIRRSLLMVVKETLNNAVKHSGATELLLQIERQGQFLVVVVQDNGRGFEAAAAKPERNGMSNITARLQELGGSCQISSQPGKGCRIELKVPLDHSRKPWSLWRLNSPGHNNKQNTQESASITS